jgi:hypothetical protein
LSQSVKSQYANLGVGQHKKEIWWVDWSGFTVANGATKTFTTAAGISVTIIFSNVNNNGSTAFLPSSISDFAGYNPFINLYEFATKDIKNAIYEYGYGGTISSFSISISATRNGVAIPISIVTSDAEACSVYEFNGFNTSGTNWNVFEYFSNSSMAFPVINCNTQNCQISNNIPFLGPTIGEVALLKTSSHTGTLNIDYVFNHGNSGRMAMTLGCLESYDMGDLPSSYGTAIHQINYGNINGCTKNVTTFQTDSLYLGNTKPDGEISDTIDDNISGFDEDCLSNNFPNYTGLGTYSLVIPAVNKTATNAYLTGWFDYNRNGIFDNNEFVAASVPSSVGTQYITLLWTGLPDTLLPPNGVADSTNFAFRFRISSIQSQTEVAKGFAIDGEVEDYYVRILGNTVLSTKLLDFNVKSIFNAALISWSTLKDVNCSSFNIQRSVMETSVSDEFKTIGTLASKGTGNYSFADNHLPATNNKFALYYRLEIVDKDGSKTYSEVKEIRLSQLTNKLINLFPNPAKGFATISCKGMKEVKIINSSGQEISQQKPRNDALFINTIQLPKGIYIVKAFMNNGEVKTEKLLVE